MGDASNELGRSTRSTNKFRLPPLPALKSSQFTTTQLSNAILTNSTVANVISTMSNSNAMARFKYLKEETMRRFSLVKQARIVSYISLIFTVIYGSSAVIVGIVTGAVSLLAIGLEMYIDCLTSAAVLWRYWKEEEFQLETEDTLEGLEKSLRVKDEVEGHREGLANFSVGLLFIALAIFVIIEGIYHIATGNTALPAQERITDAQLVAAISWICVICFSGLVWWKYVLSVKLESALIRKDALCSAFGVLLSILAGIAAWIELANTGANEQQVAETANLIDGIFAIVISGFILFEGLRTVFHNVGAVRSTYAIVNI